MEELSSISMLEIHGDAYSFGGYPLNSAIYKLTCSSGICSWSTFNQELKVARYWTVAIPVHDNFCLEDATGIISLENHVAADFLVSTVRAVVRSEIRGGT